MLDTRCEWPRLAGLLLATAFALALAQSVYRIPIQVSDSLDVILIAQHPPSSLTLLKESARWSPTTLRPMRYLQARWLSALAESLGWSYHAVFRGAHAVLAIAIVGLFLWVVNPRRWLDVAALGFALTILIGLHTFDAIMREAFPVNHYAEIVVASMFVLGAATRPARGASQVLALALLTYSLLLVESAALIWVVIVASALLKLPGIRGRTAVAATVILAAFLIARPLLDISSPAIGGHSSGWGATVLEGDELKARFATNPWPFFAYNVIGGLLSLIASEPRFGLYSLLVARQSGSLSPVVIVNIAASLLATVVVVACCAAHLRKHPRTWTPDQQMLAIGVIVSIVSAVLCVTYIKDDILSAAGVFYAVMAYVAARWLIEKMAAVASTRQFVVMAVSVLLCSSLWAFRAVGTHYDLRRVAFAARNDWALTTGRELAGGESASNSDLALATRLRKEALDRRVTSPSFMPDWAERYWIE